MELVVRQAGSRREGSPVEFPLTDRRGLLVDKDRRQLPDRRRIGYGHAILRASLDKKEGSNRNRLIAIGLIVAINAAFLFLVYAASVAFQN